MESKGDKPMTEEELQAEMEEFIKEEKLKGSSGSVGNTSSGNGGKRRGPPKRKTASNNLKEEIGE